MAADMSKGRSTLVIIDPQNDFCDPKGSLFVPGADQDMCRLAQHMRDNGRDYTDVLVSLDSHDRIAIFHPKYWVDREGNHPTPYTLLEREDFESGAWRPASSRNDYYTKRWFDQIEREGTFGMMVWPEHCIVSTWGHQICDTIMHALDEWRDTTGRSVRYTFKGETPYAEQLSAFDGTDSSWQDERSSEEMVARLAMCETVTFAGEAISHCVQESVISYLDQIRRAGGRAGQKVFVLTDCTSPVAGFDRSMSERKMAEHGATMRRSA